MARSIKRILKSVGAVLLFVCSLLCLYVVAIKPEQIMGRGGLLLVALAFLYFASYLWRIRGKN
jgi:F0F1-type ATP synthase assembly protein I